MLSQGKGRRLCLVVIAGNNYCHTWQHFHHTNVLKYLVGSAISLLMLSPSWEAQIFTFLPEWSTDCLI